jgi:hypothetical protein
MQEMRAGSASLLESSTAEWFQIKWFGSIVFLCNVKYAQCQITGSEWSASRSGFFYLQGRSPVYILYRSFGGPHSQSGRRDGEEENLSTCRELNPGRPAHVPKIECSGFFFWNMMVSLQLY